jgi:acyl-[acyl-carrier-protein]-phospholipid O-acyltransferase/long-chain-fatty-acid--[acyl-carrier-protein] ligase
LDDTHSGWLQISLAIGIGAGSFVAGFLSGKKSNTADSAGHDRADRFCRRAFARRDWDRRLRAEPRAARILRRILQRAGQRHHPAPPDAGNKGKVIATSALADWVGVLLASGFYYLLAEVLHLKPPQIFLAGAALSLAGTIYCVRLMPDSLVRMLLWLLTKTIYRIRVEGRDNIPEKGGALFVCNHVSFVDAPLLMAATDRKIRFHHRKKLLRIALA